VTRTRSCPIEHNAPTGPQIRAKRTPNQRLRACAQRQSRAKRAVRRERMLWTGRPEELGRRRYVVRAGSYSAGAVVAGEAVVTFGRRVGLIFL